jgi:hypothetical protein
VDPVPDPLLVRKSGRARNRTQELWPLDHRGGQKTTVASKNGSTEMSRNCSCCRSSGCLPLTRSQSTQLTVQFKRVQCSIIIDVSKS